MVGVKDRLAEGAGAAVVDVAHHEAGQEGSLFHDVETRPVAEPGRGEPGRGSPTETSPPWRKRLRLRLAHDALSDLLVNWG